jgi:hypothetical protein
MSTETNQMFVSIFEDGSLQDYINQNAQDPWVDTPFQGYVFMSPKQKGEFGERFVSKFFESVLFCDVKRAKTSTAGHDRVIDNILTEIKFSLATRNKKGGVRKINLSSIMCQRIKIGSVLLSLVSMKMRKIVVCFGSVRRTFWIILSLKIAYLHLNKVANPSAMMTTFAQKLIVW